MCYFMGVSYLNNKLLASEVNCWRWSQRNISAKTNLILEKHIYKDKVNLRVVPKDRPFDI